MEESAQRLATKKPSAADIIMVVVCSAVVLAGLVGLTWQIVLLAGSTLTTATATGYTSHESSGRGGCSDEVAYNPIVEFTAGDGTHVRTELTPTSEWCAPPARGETVEIMYRDDAPTQIQDTKLGEVWWAIGAVLIGGFFLFFSVGQLREPYDPASDEERDDLVGSSRS